MRRILPIAVCMLLLLAIPAAVASAQYGKEGVTRIPEGLTGEVAGSITGNMTVADVIAETENLTILAAAVEAANLTEALQTGGPYTVFAPTEEAFDALDNETLDAMLNDTGLLAAILKHHVVEGNLTSDELASAVSGGNTTLNITQEEGMPFTLTTLLGEEIVVNQSDGNLTAGEATITIADIPASNGVVHIIDAVLLPENVTDNDSVVDGAPENDTYTAIVPSTVIDTPVIPSVIDTPWVPSVIDTPRIPSVIDTPWVPSVIDTPWVPSVIDTPRIPSVIDTPRIPSVIDTPWVPSVIDTPWVPSVIDTSPVRTPTVPVQTSTVDNEPLSRPKTGTIVGGEKPDEGDGELIVDNVLGWDDAVAVLTSEGSNQTVVAVYVRQGDTSTIRGISDGTYDLYFATGENWNSNTDKFTESAGYYVFEDPFRFDTYTTEDEEYIYTHYSSWTVTLYIKDEGNATTNSINETAFPEF